MFKDKQLYDRYNNLFHDNVVTKEQVYQLQKEMAVLKEKYLSMEERTKQIISLANFLLKVVPVKNCEEFEELKKCLD